MHVAKQKIVGTLKHTYVTNSRARTDRLLGYIDSSYNIRGGSGMVRQRGMSRVCSLAKITLFVAVTCALAVSVVTADREIFVVKYDRFGGPCAYIPRMGAGGANVTCAREKMLG